MIMRNFRFQRLVIQFLSAILDIHMKRMGGLGPEYLHDLQKEGKEFVEETEYLVEQESLFS
jgi:hypothetical protein